MRKYQLVDRYPIPKRFIVTLRPERLQTALPSVPRAVADDVTLVILLVAVATAVLLREATFDKDVIYMVATGCALLAICVITLLYQLDNETENIEIARQNNLMKTEVSKQQTALDNCYHAYLNHPIHQKMTYCCQAYYSYLKNQTRLQNELRQAPYLARLYAKENAWLEHIQPFPHLLLYEDFFKIPRGKRLEAMGVMMMEDFYSYYNHHGVFYLRKYFSMTEIRKFLPIHRQLVNSFTYVENEQDINDLKLTFIEEIEEELDDSTWDYEHCLRNITITRNERLHIYLSFRGKYSQLIKRATVAG